LTRPIITLTTDYGTGDHLVGVMKGVILSINPEVQIVDITHGVLAHDILDGALTIGQAYNYFPPKTIHVVVVDPGVGTPRRPILVASDQHYFVAPDNGVLSAVYDQTEALYAWHITSEHYFRNPISNTFHGRDVFAPVAAWLSKSWQTSAFGDPITDFTRFGIPKPKANGNTIKAVVLKVDNFGNLITNVKAEDAPALTAADGKFTIRVGSGEVKKVLQTFAQGTPGEAFGVIGSSGYLEISLNKGNAARSLGAVRGAEVTVELG
jgi:S-adenosylmethionine hydrolase